MLTKRESTIYEDVKYKSRRLKVYEADSLSDVNDD
jgi:hypothetical protein